MARVKKETTPKAVDKDLLELINSRSGEGFTSVGEYVVDLARQFDSFEIPPEILASELYWLGHRLDDEALSAAQTMRSTAFDMEAAMVSPPAKPTRFRKSKKSDLQKAATAVRKAVGLLAQIVRGEIKDNGTDDDKWAAQEIKNAGFWAITHFSQIGVNPEAVMQFYRGKESSRPTIDHEQKKLAR